MLLRTFGLARASTRSTGQATDSHATPARTPTGKTRPVRRLSRRTAATAPDDAAGRKPRKTRHPESAGRPRTHPNRSRVLPHKQRRLIRLGALTPRCPLLRSWGTHEQQPRLFPPVMPRLEHLPRPREQIIELIAWSGAEPLEHPAAEHLRLLTDHVRGRVCRATDTSPAQPESSRARDAAVRADTTITGSHDTVTVCFTHAITRCSGGQSGRIQCSASALVDSAQPS
jgi:hypothetical protein